MYVDIHTCLYITIHMHVHMHICRDTLRVLRVKGGAVISYMKV